MRRLAERPQIDDAFLRVPYGEPDLIAFSVEVITAFGFDFASRPAGQVDSSVLHVVRV